MDFKKYAIALVEGETEKAIFSDFKIMLKYPVKKIIKANLWNNEIKKIIPLFTEQSNILVIFDTDRIENLQRFKENIKLLRAKKHSVYLLQQKSNFEEEICHASTLSHRKLLEHFCPKIVSVDNFKNEFIARKNRLKQLDELGLNKSKLWERELIEELQDHSELHSSHNKLFE
ncbi:DUF4276 domain-containing protein [Erwinia rhapontici]|uniref:hypothetical protein n=1 Tax=Erwinia rhapontici TaxID=55212 RepID=UPI003D366798